MKTLENVLIISVLGIGGYLAYRYISSGGLSQQQGQQQGSPFDWNSLFNLSAAVSQSGLLTEVYKSVSSSSSTPKTDFTSSESGVDTFNEGGGIDGENGGGFESGFVEEPLLA